MMLAFHLQNFDSKDDTIFCGVFDGHGPNGHLVANRVRDRLPTRLSANLRKYAYKQISTGNVKSGTTKRVTTEQRVEDTDASSGNEKEGEYPNEKNGEYPEFFAALRASFLQAFYFMDKDLKRYGSIDCAFSGTTAVTVIKQVELLLCLAKLSFLVRCSMMLFHYCKLQLFLIQPFYFAFLYRDEIL